MSGHTPGQWEANRYNEIWSVVLDGGADAIKTFVASVHDFDKPQDTKANARLIAAAPDLLAVCRSLAAVMAAWGPERRGETLALIHTANEAAIAKAEGR